MPPDSTSHGEILRAIGKLEGTMTTFVAATDARMTQMEKVQDHHRVSISNLKQRQAWWSGAAAAIGAAAGFLLKAWNGHS